MYVQNELHLAWVTVDKPNVR